MPIEWGLEGVKGILRRILVGICEIIPAEIIPAEIIPAEIIGKESRHYNLKKIL